jgi:hypothetical protein
LQEAKSEYVGKINAWFDQTVDRVSQRFTYSARWITLFGALLVAFSFQIDVIALVNRLSLDDAFRNSVNGQAQKLMEKAVPAEGAGLKENDNSQQKADIQNDYYKLLSTAGLIVMPTDSNWRSEWNWHRFPGILLSALLLSLGAPFWYNTLQNLLRLRSALAQKDDQQRASRQQTQPDSPQDSLGSPTVPDLLKGERGDLKAVG